MFFERAIGRTAFSLSEACKGECEEERGPSFLRKETETRIRIQMEHGLPGLSFREEGKDTRCWGKGSGLQCGHPHKRPSLPAEIGEWERKRGGVVDGGRTQSRRMGAVYRVKSKSLGSARG